MKVRSLSQEDPWRREWLPTPVLMPRELRGAWQATVRGVTESPGIIEWLTLSLSPIPFLPSTSTPTPHPVSRPLSITTSAAAASLQLCSTLCDPIEGSPPGSPIPGILQARTLEWVAISFSNAWKWKVKVKSLSHVRLFATPWTVAYQAPPSMGVSSQEYLHIYSHLLLPIHLYLQVFCFLEWLWRQVLLCFASAVSSSSSTTLQFNMWPQVIYVPFSICRVIISFCS